MNNTHQNPVSVSEKEFAIFGKCNLSVLSGRLKIEEILLNMLPLVHKAYLSGEY